MKLYRVSGDLLVAFIVEVEADSQEAAEKQVIEMGAPCIVNEGNTDIATASVEIDGCEEITEYE